MARPARIEFPGAVYHIISRGNRRQNVFLDDDDNRQFLRLLKDVIHRFNWLCHSYCLMGNHYHLLLETPDGILSNGMRYLNSVYSQRFNRKYRQSGHVFQGRYSSKLVDSDQQFLITARYIVRNPVEAHMVNNPAEWKWSSFKATTGASQAPSFLTADHLLSFISEDKVKAQALFNSFVRADLGNYGEGMIEILANEEKQQRLRAVIRTLLDHNQSLAPIQKKQRLKSRPTLIELFQNIDIYDQQQRDPVVVDAFRNYGYTQTEIGNHLGLHRTTISKITNKKGR